MNILIPLVSLFASATAGATLLITEINSNGTPADFWELTNFGTTAVDLGGHVWTDSTLVGPIKVAIPSGTMITPQESVVFAITADVAGFRAAWGLAPTVKVLPSTDPGLGQNDSIRLFTSAAATTPIRTLNYAAGGFIRSNGASSLGGHAGLSAGGTLSTQSLVLNPNFPTSAPRYAFATGGNFGSWQAPGGSAVGSPGVVGSPASNSAPYFTGEARSFWVIGKDLAYSTYRIHALDADVGQTVAYTVVSKPTWLSIVHDGSGRMRLTGTPNSTQTGDHAFTIRATDSSPGNPLSTERAFLLTVFPSSSPVLLNEYNGVGSSEILDPADPGSDTFFGTVAGNGGDWFELVVVGTGIAGSTVDLRGWRIDVLSGGQTETLVLSADPYWANVAAGSILTFTEDNSAAGGLDTVIHKTSARSVAGYTWSNIWIRDPVFIDQTASSIGSGINIDNNNTWFIIRNATGTSMFGPCGEGIAADDVDGNGYPDTIEGLSSQEVLALRGNPIPAIDPLFGAYRTQSLSSFGSPNRWSAGTRFQSFASYQTPNTPPVITTAPVGFAVGNYSYTIHASDPNNMTPSVSVSELPPFLGFNGGIGTGVVSSNRPLALADAGEYPIRVLASDGTLSTPQPYLLTVFNPKPTVILNEYNAVDSTYPVGTFLNGGTASADIDGFPHAADRHFGRVEGNGGDWFELVVVGTGSPATVDLRGWKIEIGQPAGREFRSSSMIELSSHAYWAAVPTGTILTFIERNTIQGGLDTEINRRNRRATLGDIWTNIWIGDSNFVTYTDATANGYVITGGEVSGVAVNDLGTRIRLKDSSGRIAFGAVGEGIAPLSGVNQSEVLELQAHPSPSVSPLSIAYQDDAVGSSFGWPNEWGTSTQSFASYIYQPTPYETWIAEFSLANGSLAADPDEDGRSNLAEYAFGGNPTIFDQPVQSPTIVSVAGSFQLTYARRNSDPSLVYRHQISGNLADWTEYQNSVSTMIPHPSRVGFVIVSMSVPAHPTEGRRFVRAAVE